VLRASFKSRDATLVASSTCDTAQAGKKAKKKRKKKRAKRKRR
jgi:hypothetical protein